jgi:tetratricopeptide (TPR) repeat protein
VKKNNSYSAKDRLAADQTFVAPPSEARPDRRVAWEWNIPLLIKTGVGATLLVLSLGAAYSYQSLRISNGILDKIADAEQSGATEDQIKWLKRYIALVPRDKDRLIELAKITDDQVSTQSDIEEARKRLSAALTACDETPGYEEQSQELRKRLIPRMLQFGSRWATEVEKQIFRLKSPEGDAETTKWLAQSLVAQRADSQYSDRDPSKYERSADYWQWLANLPTGEVYYQATQVNPNDVDLLAAFVVICRTSKDWMFAPGEPVDEALVQGRESSAIEALRGMPADGHAQFVVYKMLSSPEQSQAFAKQASLPAVERLEKNLPAALAEKASADDEAAALESLSAAGPVMNSLLDYQPYWDWQLALESALSLGKDDLKQTRQIFERLLALDSPRIARTQREATYMQYGSWLLDQGDSAQAKEVWQSGTKAISESLDLIGALAYVYTTEKSFDEARKSIDEFMRLVEMQETRLDGPLGARLTSDVKRSIRDRLAAGAWESSLLDGFLSAQTGDLVHATQVLEKAFQSPIPLAPEKRVRAGRALADVYLQRQLLDMRGLVLDKCITLAPDDVSLRRDAADAWRALGASDRVVQQLTTLDDGSFEAALEIARLKGYAEASKPKERADLVVVQDALKEARSRYQTLDADRQAAAPLWQLDLLELSYSAMVAGDEAPAEAVNSRLDKLETVAESNPGVSDVQMLASSSFASSGRLAAADAAVGRLEQIAQASSASADKANVELAKAGILALTDKIDEAISILVAASEKQPENRLVLLQTAANTLLRQERTLEAYEILRTVPDEELDTQTLMTLAGMSNLLKSNKTQAIDLASDLARWTARLKEIEGPDGTHWRYLAAEALLIESATSARSQTLLNEATKIFGEIDARRPRWGRGAVLGARIAEQKGFRDEAVTLYRRAIRDGDRQISTNLGLVRLLISLNRMDLAEQQLERIQSTTGSEMPTLVLADILQRKGDFKRAISLAREFTQQKPDDDKSWLLLARSLMAGGSLPGASEDEIANMQQEALLALDRATELTGGKSRQVWAERIRYQLAVGGPQAAREEIELMEASALPPVSRLTLAAGAFFELKDYVQVRERLDAILQLDGKNSEAHLLYCELHNRLGDPVSSLDSLRKAQQAAPENQDIRERLALNLAFSTDVAGEVDPAAREKQWMERQREIDDLLQAGVSAETPRKLLVQAMINLKKGDAKRQANAVAVLRQLATSSQVAAESKRLLAGHYVGLWEAEKDCASDVAKNHFSQALALYEDLLQVGNPDPTDSAYLTAVYLVSSQREKAAGRPELSEQRLEDAERTLVRLEKIAGSSLASLQLRLRIAEARGRQADVASITNQWMEGIENMDALGKERVWELAGQTLTQLGFAEDSLVWLEQVYKHDPTKYKGYVFALARAKQAAKAEQICVSEYMGEPSAEAAALLCEVVLLDEIPQLSAGGEEVVMSALAKFPESGLLLESVGTLRLMQGRDEEATQYFERSQAKSPDSVRTLNNMAMALSNVPNRQQEALASIQRAMDIRLKQLGGREQDPELIDTLAVVQARMGKLEDARKSLEQAFSLRADPRFQIHLADVLLELKQDEELKALWMKINQSNLDSLVLNTEERDTVKRMRERFKDSS